MLRAGWKEVRPEWLWVGPEVRLPSWTEKSDIKDDWSRPCVVQENILRGGGGARASEIVRVVYVPGYVFGNEWQQEYYGGAEPYCLVGYLAGLSFHKAMTIAEAQMELLMRTRSRAEWDSRFYDRDRHEWGFGHGDTSLLR